MHKVIETKDHSFGHPSENPAEEGMGHIKGIVTTQKMKVVLSSDKPNKTITDYGRITIVTGRCEPHLLNMNLFWGSGTILFIEDTFKGLRKHYNKGARYIWIHPASC